MSNFTNDTLTNRSLDAIPKRDDSGQESYEWTFYGLGAYSVCILFVNLTQCLALAKSKKTSVSYIIMQIALLDIALALLALPDFYNSLSPSWNYTNEDCSLYRGTELLVNNWLKYLLICLNFHVITLANLHETDQVKNDKNPLTAAFAAADCSSSECLVVGRRKKNRPTMDYRKRRRDVAATLPLTLAWIVSVSLSVPNYFLSSTVRVRDHVLCVTLQNRHGVMLHALMLTFCTFLPVSLMVGSLSIVAYKLYEQIKRDVDSVLNRRSNELRRLLVLASVLSISYVATSYQRDAALTVVTVKEFFISENYYYKNSVSKYLLLLHYSGTGFRSLICCVMMPSFRLMFDKTCCSGD